MSNEPTQKELSVSDRSILEKQVNLIHNQVSRVEMPFSQSEESTQVVSIEDRTQRLLDNCRNMSDQTDRLIVQIGKMAKPLTFTVPAEATEVRAALSSLGFDPNQMTYQNYVDLLKMQMELSRTMGAEVSHGFN